MFILINRIKFSVFILLLIPSILYGEHKKNVLLLNSYHPGYIWTDSISSVIKKRVDSSEFSCSLFIEYMDTKRVSPDLIFTNILHTLELKYSKVKFDVVICSDNNALNFVVKNRKGFFKGIPVVFCGINNYRTSMLKGESGITGITENHNYSGTLDIALTLHPGNQDLVVIGDYTTTGYSNRSAFRRYLQPYLKNHLYYELNGLSSADMIKKLRNIDNSIIFYLDYFLTENGEVLSIEKSRKLIIDNVKSPVYIMDDSKMGSGVVGGFIVSSSHQGKNAAELALRILRGENPDSIGIINEKRNIPTFDYRVLQSFGADISLLPEDSVLINAPSYFMTVINENRGFFILLVLGFVFLITAVIFLQRSRLKHKRMKSLLRRSEEKYRNLIEDMDDTVFSLDERGIITFVSSVIERGGRYNIDDVIGSHYKTVIHCDDRKIVEEKLKQCLTERIAPFELRVVDQKDAVNIVRTTVRARTDEESGDVSIVGLMVNISDIKEKENQLVRAIEEAGEANAAKSRFLSTISHELRTPLNVIMGISDLLSQSEEDDKKKSFISMIKSSGASLLEIINEIFNFVEAEKVSAYEKENIFSVFEIIKELVSIFRLDLETKGLSLIMNLDSSVPEYYRGESGRIRKALTNVLSNAVKFTEKGRIRVSLEPGKANDWGVPLIVSVEDTGIGVPDSEKPMIFDEFYKCDHGNEKIYSGTGMGLAVARKILHEINSTIDVFDSPSGGSTFRIQLNIEKDACSGKPEIRIQDDSVFKQRILLVEDNVINRRITEIFLKKMDYSVDTANNGLEAVNLIKSENYKAVLMDCQMPVMDGFEATREIKKIKNVPVIALTAHVFKEDRERCFESGMVDYIAKPVNKAVLFSTLAKWIS